MKRMPARCTVCPMMKLALAVLSLAASSPGLAAPMSGEPVPTAALPGLFRPERAGAPAAAEAGTQALSGCTPPQPKSRCAPTSSWDGVRCVDGQELAGNARSSSGWSNEAWRVYFSSLLAQRGLGRTALPASLAAVEPGLVAMGASLQRNSAGEIRGRVFLPTGDPENLWGRAVDVVQGGGWCRPWGWTIR